MQYRAIGLVRGQYQPSEEQLNRGMIVTDDGATIEAVLLGRVTSLIKKHIDLEASHLWVVYPRTRQSYEAREDSPESSDGGLHLQIVGVWEPETLGMPGENPRSKGLQTDEIETETETEHTNETETEHQEAVATSGIALSETTDSPQPSAEPVDSRELPSENYFSIRGEILNYDEEAHQIMVKIVQGAKRSGKPPKAFRLHVSGELSGKTVGYFWELDVERQGEELVLTAGRSVGIVPPKKKKKGKPFGGPKGKRRSGPSMGSKPKPAPNKDKPRIRPSAPVKSNPL
jgi:hypothetical protein